MSVVQALLLGLLQGITEFLPVSSSGHLVLARALMGLEDVPLFFDVVLHVATLVIVVYVFRQRVWGILSALGRALLRRQKEGDREHLRLALLLAAASALTAVTGLGISSLEVREQPGWVCLLLLVTALLLVLSSVLGRGRRPLDETGWPQALIMGAAQGLGVFPGISRSGITISSALMSGMSRQAAGEFSFLLSIPAVGGAFILTLRDAAAMSSGVPPLSLAAGFLAALAAGYASLKLLLRLISGGRLWLFAFYLIPAGIWGLLHFGI